MSDEQLGKFSTELREKIKEWLNWDKNPKFRGEIEKLVNENAVKELEERLLQRMSFGTAGLRSRMGAGNSMMNDLTIIQTAQGLLAYLQKTFPNLKENGIVFGFDGRYNSDRFAKLSAAVFLQANVKVYLFRQITPTPFVPYSILRFKCVAGVMVTASHNPKDDNGYKVYFDNGAQIISPHDKGISDSILDHLEPLESSWNVDILKGHPNLIEPFDEVYKNYFDDVKQLCYHRDLNSKTDLTFTYTAMHGVGYEFSLEVFKSFNHKPFVPVKQQILPDPEFPTVKFPNPEEGKSALNLSIETANANNSTVILANDPDADRLAVAEKLPNNTWKIFNGNEIGALIGWWLWFNYHQKNPNVDPKDVYLLYSTVSSNILRAIGEVEGFNCEDTLTGFKWMGNKAIDVMKEGKKVLFAFEEAIGFMCGTRVLDKDGITAEAIVAEMAVYLKAVEKRTLNEQLNWIYDHYGYHVSNNSYYLCYDQAIIDRLFKRLRHFNDLNNEEFTYPTTCGPYKIKKIRDLTAGVTVNLENGERSIPNLPTSKASHMITFYFENGCTCTIRTSGTEPKIKWYSELRDTSKGQRTRDQIKEELDDLINHLVEEFYQPKVNNLKERTS